MLRVAVLWFLINREWTHHESLATLLLVLLLFPEGALLPSTVVWTVPLSLAFTAVLVVGSFIWVGALLFVGRWILGVS